MSVEEARRREALEREARRRGLEPWQVEAMQAVDDKLMAEIVSDFRRGPSQPSGLLGPSKPEPVKRSAAVERPLESPPGVAILDRLMDNIDAADRRRKEALAQSVERLKKTD
jgi:hypothetical protein